MHQQGLGFYTAGAMTNIAGNRYPGMHGPQSHASFEAGWSREVERRAAHYAKEAPEARRTISNAIGSGGMFGQQQVEGTGQIDVKLNAPHGTSIRAQSGGIFQRVNVRRICRCSRPTAAVHRYNRTGRARGRAESAALRVRPHNPQSALTAQVEADGRHPVGRGAPPVARSLVSFPRRALNHTPRGMRRDPGRRSRSESPPTSFWTCRLIPDLSTIDAGPGQKSATPRLWAGAHVGFQGKHSLKRARRFGRAIYCRSRDLAQAHLKVKKDVAGLSGLHDPLTLRGHMHYTSISARLRQSCRSGKIRWTTAPS